MDIDSQDGSQVLNAVAEDTTFLLYFLERIQKAERGPPNAWKSKNPPRDVKTQRENVIPTLSGIRSLEYSLKKVQRLLFDNDIIHKIITNNNVTLSSASEKLDPSTNKANCRNTDDDEVNILIYLLLLVSVPKSNNENMTCIFLR